MTQFTFDTSIVSDLHKDARGWRPREYFWETWEAASDEEKQEIWDGLCNELNWEMERERKAEKQAVAEFEKQIARNLSYGAADRQQAIRWIVESLDPSQFDLMYGGGWVCWELGLPYSMEDEFKEVCKELADQLAETTDEPYSNKW
jgi:predicted Fe-S protein YdhL (DUF1289 family)